MTPAKIVNLEARVASLVAERDGVTALLTKRISHLQASLSRVRDTLSRRLETTEQQLCDNAKQLVEAVKFKTDSD